MGVLSTAGGARKTRTSVLASAPTATLALALSAGVAAQAKGVDGHVRHGHAASTASRYVDARGRWNHSPPRPAAVPCRPDLRHAPASTRDGRGPRISPWPRRFSECEPASPTCASGGGLRDGMDARGADHRRAGMRRVRRGRAASGGSIRSGEARAEPPQK